MGGGRCSVLSYGTGICHYAFILCFFVCFFFCFLLLFILFALPIPFFFSICLLSDIYKFDGIVDTSTSKSAL